jgi:3-oxoadipate enol-lactonase
VPAVGRFRYLEAVPGHGAPSRGTLLLIHAFPLSARMFAPQLAPLADFGWRVIAPHLRRFDGADSDPAARSVDDYAADLQELLDALHVEQAVIGGVSLGGYVAFALLRRAPRRFRALLLADTKSEADTPDAAEGRKKMLQLVREKGAAGVADDMMPKLLGRTTRAGRPDLVERVRTMVLSNPTDAIADAIGALMTRPDSTPLLAAIQCPTLIIVGEEDVVTPRPLAEGMHRAIAGSELVGIAEAGHLANLEQPDSFNAALAGFLEHRV